MIDIVGIGEDIRTFNAQTSKAANVLQVQIGSLEYAPDFGIDMNFFLNPDFQFQNESFKSYLIQRLTESHVNVNQVLDQIESLYRQFTFVVGDAENNSVDGGFIR